MYTDARPKKDIRVKVKNIKYGNEIIGYTGALETKFTLKIYKMKRSAALKKLLVTCASWISNQQQCFDELIQNLNI